MDVWSGLPLETLWIYEAVLPWLLMGQGHAWVCGPIALWVFVNVPGHDSNCPVAKTGYGIVLIVSLPAVRVHMPSPQRL